MNGSIGRNSSTIRIRAMPVTMQQAEPIGGVPSEMPVEAGPAQSGEARTRALCA